MNNEFWLPVLTDGLFAAIAAIGFAVISNPPKRAISVVALLGAFGHACRFYLLHYTPLNLTISSLFAAFGIGMLSMLAARLVRCPAEVFSFPALLPMIPGMYAYKTVLALIRFIPVTTTDCRNLPQWPDYFICYVCTRHRCFTRHVHLL